MTLFDRSRAATPSNARLVAWTSLVVLAMSVSACESAESKQMKALAGSYISDYESEIPPGQTEPWITSRNTMVFRPDGRWTLSRVRVVSGDTTIDAPDSGSYRILGTTLAMGATEQGPAAQLTISGDTLWSLDTGERARAEAVTGLRFAPPKEQGFYVRQR